MKRENVVGRANVADTPELEAYYLELRGELPARARAARHPHEQPAPV